MFKFDEFMRISQEIDLPNGEKVTIRVLSDLEMNARHDYALAQAMRVSEQLKDVESELYKTKVLPLQDSSIDSLLDLMAQGRMYELDREARELYRLDFVVPRENATLAEDIDTEKKQSEVELQVYKDMAQYITNGLKEYRDKVAELPRETILKELHQRAIQAYSYSTSQDSEVYYTVWCATEINGKKRWKTVDDVHQLPMKVIDHLHKIYKELDSIDPWEITKSEPEGSPDGMADNIGDSAESPTG